MSIIKMLEKTISKEALEDLLASYVRKQEYVKSVKTVDMGRMVSLIKDLSTIQVHAYRRVSLDDPEELDSLLKKYKVMTKNRYIDPNTLIPPNYVEPVGLTGKFAIEFVEEQKIKNVDYLITKLEDEDSEKLFSERVNQCSKFISTVTEDLDGMVALFNSSSAVNQQAEAVDTLVRLIRRRTVANAKRRALAKGYPVKTAWMFMPYVNDNKVSRVPKALIDQSRIDPKVFIEMYGRLGGYNFGGKEYTAGVWKTLITLSWVSAGFKHGNKLELQLETGVVVPNGYTMSKCVQYVRGYKWIQRNRRKLEPYLSNKAIMALGRLSPGARRAAIIGVKGVQERRRLTLLRGNRIVKIRIADLNWDMVARYEKLVMAANSNKSTNAVNGLKHFHETCKLDSKGHGLTCSDNVLSFILGKPVPMQFTEKLNNLSIDAGFMGYKSVKMYMLVIINVLNRYIKISDQSKTVVTEKDYIEIAEELDTISLSKIKMDWIINMPDDTLNALLRNRSVVNNDIVGTFRMLFRLDEVEDVDIHSVKDGLHVVLDRAHQREMASRPPVSNSPLVKIPEWVQDLPPEIRFLNTSAELAQEAKKLNHCVYRYSNNISSGECFILSVSTPGAERTTAEITMSDDSFSIIQHRAYKNTTVSEKAETFLHNALLNLISLNTVS